MSSGPPLWASPRLHLLNPSRSCGFPHPALVGPHISLGPFPKLSSLSLVSRKRSYFSLNFLSDFIEKNSGLGAFRLPSPCLLLGQKHLFTRYPVSTRWGPGLRTGKEATGGPASALEPRRESQRDTLARARAPSSHPAHARGGPCSRGSATPDPAREPPSLGSLCGGASWRDLGVTPKQAAAEPGTPARVPGTAGREGRGRGPGSLGVPGWRDGVLGAGETKARQPCSLSFK